METERKGGTQKVKRSRSSTLTSEKGKSHGSHPEAKISPRPGNKDGENFP